MRRVWAWLADDGHQSDVALALVVAVVTVLALAPKVLHG